MNATEYINENLPSLASKFPGVTLKYTYDQMYAQHTIAVNPSDMYHVEGFAQAQVQFEISFIKQFPFETIYFAPVTELDLDGFAPATQPAVIIEEFGLFTEEVRFTKKLLSQYPEYVLNNIATAHVWDKVAETELSASFSSERLPTYAAAA